MTAMKHIKLSQTTSTDSGDIDAIQCDAAVPLEPEEESDHHELPAPTEKRRSTTSMVIKITIGLILTGLVLFVLIDSMTNKRIPEMKTRMLTWCEENPLEGTIIYTVCFIVGVIIMIPATVFVVAGGFIFSHVYGFGFGVAIAIFVSLIGTAVGSTSAFTLGRYLFKDCLTPSVQKYKLLKVLDRAMDHHGFRIMVLLHLNPVSPFGILNYICGSLSISGKDYFFSAVGTTPGVILYCFLGASAQNLTALEHAGKDRTATIFTIVVGLIAGISLVKVMGNYAKKELEILEVQYALEEDGAEENVRPSTVLSTDEMDVEVVEQRSQDEGDIPTIV
ncbi:unnamed protein product [Cylindrotheca closterium]|uniref:VTT domain-containing protein n=1 Tax=Cylindrotheca closterium TaxID=2856 RepID=A0AAD2PV18_9STRA|nr:unnamed protein product [Cylindrotheca closterium]